MGPLDPARGVAQSPRILWSPRFSVGNELLDKQHQILIVQINRLADWIDGPKARSTYHDILNELAVYAEVHFKTEEAMLERSRYAALPEHRDGHSLYQTYLTDVMFDAMSGVADKANLQTFLVDWWTNHILLADMQYKGSLA